jgi:hypothetical protein
VAALLPAVKLIFKVDPGCTLTEALRPRRSYGKDGADRLSEKLCQLHDSRKTAVADMKPRWDGVIVQNAGAYPVSPSAMIGRR